MDGISCREFLYSFLLFSMPSFPILSDVPGWPSVMVSVQSLHCLLWKRKGEDKRCQGCWSHCFLVQLQHCDAPEHLCTLPVSKPLTGMSCSVQLPHPQFPVLVSYLPKHGTFLQPPSQNAASRGETFRADCPESSTTFHEGGFHPRPALSSRHLVTCLAQISACQILNEKDGSNCVCLCLSHRRNRFLFFFFDSVCQF